jgi:hypothetical protein
LHNKSYTVILDEDEQGNLIFPIPQELFEGENAWSVGDTILWQILDDQAVVVNQSLVTRKQTKN